MGLKVCYIIYGRYGENKVRGDHHVLADFVAISLNRLND